jgi:hypothetical protein
MRKFILLAIFLPSSLLGQTFSNKHFGISLGLTFNVGTHVNNVGINVNTYYTDYFYQFNLGQSFTLNAINFGKRTHFWESRSSAGLNLMAGKRNLTPDFQMNGLFHNTTYNYGLGFNYLLYKDNAGTSQLSGGWAIHLKNTSLLVENDVFGGQAKDRFRTGHFAVSYRYQNMKFITGMYIWTGETKNSQWQKIPLKHQPSGFRILEDLPYGKTSHGIAYGAVYYNIGAGQNLHLKLGIDSEHLRHAVQNRFIHDLLFLPKKVERNTPHYPRLDERGCPVFEKSNVRKNRFYFQQGLNENWGGL